MTKRAAWPMVVPAGTTTVGTARVRDDSRPTMTTAQRRIYEKTGVPPQSSALDDFYADDPFAAQAPSLCMAKAKKPPKYRNTKCEHNGIKFDSEKERSRWFHLIQLQAAGQISDLELQVPFILTERKKRDDGKWERASKYVADFVYIDTATGKRVVEDVKSEATRKNRTYIQKRKQMLDKHDITIKEI
ncbi:DUF1064 domain-containing protein [Paraburkholderia sp. LEh10]|uniref:DUF1064 domain-containing protein n=1 Tax=Paraburkholderia sp. LEh10 TaxID=2821353 RepID=UPI001AE35DDE|nr:DUF1064 domain-containing protein [Paraburkholderia sp. LEh10]MBP0589298.1 DUF1064 domain-containing protein [Paraburkholderia sp. LEh10]